MSLATISTDKPHNVVSDKNANQSESNLDVKLKPRPEQNNGHFVKHTEALKELLQDIVGDKDISLAQDKALRELLVIEPKRLETASEAIDEMVVEKNTDFGKKLGLYLGGAIPIDLYQLGMGLTSGATTGAVRSAEALDGQILNWRLITDPKSKSKDQVDDFLNKYAPSPMYMTGVGMIDLFNPMNQENGVGGNIFNPFAKNYPAVLDNINSNANSWGDTKEHKKTNILHVAIASPLVFGATQLLGRVIFPATVGTSKQAI